MNTNALMYIHDGRSSIIQGIQIVT